MGSFTSVHKLVPLQLLSMQSSSSQVIEVPVHIPPPQVSPYVQRSPSSHKEDNLHSQVPPALVQKYTEPPQLTTSQLFVALHV